MRQSVRAQARLSAMLTCCSCRANAASTCTRRGGGQWGQPTAAEVAVDAPAEDADATDVDWAAAGWLGTGTLIVGACCVHDDATRWVHGGGGMITVCLGS